MLTVVLDMDLFTPRLATCALFVQISNTNIHVLITCRDTLEYIMLTKIEMTRT